MLGDRAQRRDQAERRQEAHAAEGEQGGEPEHGGELLDPGQPVPPRAEVLEQPREEGRLAAERDGRAADRDPEQQRRRGAGEPGPQRAGAGGERGLVRLAPPRDRRPRGRARRPARGARAATAARRARPAGRARPRRRAPPSPTPRAAAAAGPRPPGPYRRSTITAAAISANSSGTASPPPPHRSCSRVSQPGSVTVPPLVEPARRRRDDVVVDRVVGDGERPQRAGDQPRAAADPAAPARSRARCPRRPARSARRGRRTSRRPLPSRPAGARSARSPPSTSGRSSSATTSCVNGLPGSCAASSRRRMMSSVSWNPAPPARPSRTSPARPRRGSGVPADGGHHGASAPWRAGSGQPVYATHRTFFFFFFFFFFFLSLFFFLAAPEWTARRSPARCVPGRRGHRARDLAGERPVGRRAWLIPGALWALAVADHAIYNYVVTAPARGLDERGDGSRFRWLTRLHDLWGGGGEAVPLLLALIAAAVIVDRRLARAAVDRLPRKLSFKETDLPSWARPSAARGSGLPRCRGCASTASWPTGSPARATVPAGASRTRPRSPLRAARCGPGSPAPRRRCCSGSRVRRGVALGGRAGLPRGAARGPRCVVGRAVQESGGSPPCPSGSPPCSPSAASGFPAALGLISALSALSSTARASAR